MSIGPGCSITVAAMSSNTPAASISTLPPPASSAGVPQQHHRQAEFVGDLGECQRGADPDAAMMLCPQA